jgi:hypothetical protein
MNKDTDGTLRFEWETLIREAAVLFNALEEGIDIFNTLNQGWIKHNTAILIVISTLFLLGMLEVFSFLVVFPIISIFVIIISSVTLLLMFFKRSLNRVENKIRTTLRKIEYYEKMMIEAGNDEKDLLFDRKDIFEKEMQSLKINIK